MLINLYKYKQLIMSQIGKDIPDFTVQAYYQNEFKEIKKKDVLGKWSIFFFYPADFTFVCPTELEDLANTYEKFKDDQAGIYAISCHTPFIHKIWTDDSKSNHKIQFPLIVDPS